MILEKKNIDSSKFRHSMESLGTDMQKHKRTQKYTQKHTSTKRNN